VPLRGETTKELRNCNLLVISDRYPHAKDPISSSFVKNQIEYLKDYVKKIYVIALNPFVPKFLSHFDFMDRKGRWDGYAEDYKYDNVEVYFAKPWALPLEFSRKRRGDEGLKSARRVVSKNNLNFDLIHAHFTYPSGYVAAKLKETSKTGMILTVHEDRNWFRNELALGDEKLLYAWQNADRIIRVNRADLNEFKKINIDPKKLVHLPNGFSAERFTSIDKMTAKRQLKIPPDKLVLLNVAALEPYKGQEYLVRAMKMVTAFNRNVILYIVGKGSLEGFLQNQIEELDLSENIVLAGGDKSDMEIRLWMNCADIFVLPSLSESFGIVQIEAMACGVPVVATYNGGSEEIIIDKKLGILVDAGDEKSLAEAVIEAVGIEWDRNYIKKYAQQFTWDKIAQEIANIYEDVLFRKLDA